MEEQREHLQHTERHEPGVWRACDAGSAGTPTTWVRAWAQLRLQGAFARSATGALPRCRLCERGPESAAHLLSTCVRGACLTEEWAARHGVLLPAAEGDRVRYVLGGAPAELQRIMAGLAARLRQACLRQARRPLWPEVADDHPAPSQGTSSDSSEDSSEATLPADSAADSSESTLLADPAVE